MAFKLPNRVRMSITGTPGTGDVSLNVATSGYQTLLNAGLADGDTFPYVIEDGANWELGVGTYHSSGPSFSRTTVRASSSGGTSKISATSSAIIFSSIMGEDAGGGAPALSGLTDVTLTSPANNDLLTYDTGSGKWVNAAASGGGTTPSIVQSGAFCQGDSPYVMGSAPVAGNLLVAFVGFWSSSGLPNADWHEIVRQSASGDLAGIYIKIADGADTSSLSPTFNGGGTNAVIYEIADASTVVGYIEAHDLAGTSQVLNIGAPASSLALGAFNSVSTDPVSVTITGTGITAGPNATAGSGTGSGYPRTANGWHKSFSTAGSANATVTYGTSTSTNKYGCVVK